MALPPDSPRPAPPAATVPRPGQPFLTGREFALSAGAVVIALLAYRVFDEWRGPLGIVSALLFPGLVAYFAGRGFWRWWRTQPSAIALPGAMAALSFAVVSWLDVALATAVRGINEGNYALIIIAPAAMLLGALVSAGGLLAAGLGAVVALTALTRPTPRGALVVAMGVAAIVLNLAAIVRLVEVFARN